MGTIIVQVRRALIGFSTECSYTTCMPYKCAMKHYKTSRNNSWFTENTSYSISGRHLNVMPLIWNVDCFEFGSFSRYCINKEVCVPL